MKRFFLSFAALALAVLAGWFLRDVWHPASGIRDQPTSSSDRTPRFYQSPMHPWIKSDKPGKCTICGMDLAPVYDGEKALSAGAGIVTLGSNSIQTINVTTAEATVRPLQRVLRFAGTIEDDSTRHRVLSAYVDARIERLHLTFQGAEVVEGQPLATVYSPALLNAARDYLSFLKTTDAKSNANAVGAAAARLKALGLTADQIARLSQTFSETNLFFEILSPMTGTVVLKEIYEGQTVKEGDRLFELADFSTMWLKFDAYERDLPWLAVGQSAEVRSDALSGRTLTGKIAFIDPNFDEKTRTTKVRVEIANPLVETNGRRRREISHRLFAEAIVASSTPDVLTIPRLAMLNPGGATVVYVEKSPGTYERRALKLGRTGTHLVEVLDGLVAGDRVVATGNLLIDAQAQLDQGSLPPGSGMSKPIASAKAGTLSAEQRQALEQVFSLAAELAAALAADDLKALQDRSMGLHSIVPAAAEKLAESAGWSTHMDAANRAAHFPAPKDLATARARFHAFVTPVVELAKLARLSGQNPAPRIFQCPMTKKSFQNAPTNALWLQMGSGAIRNPYFGAEMLDCGTEVKP